MVGGLGAQLAYVSSDHVCRSLQVVTDHYQIRQSVSIAWGFR